MISIYQPRQHRFSALPVLALLYLMIAAPILTGCATDRESTMMRSSRARAVGILRSEREQQERELELWQATRGQADRDIRAARLESVRISSQLRGVRGLLARELRELAAAEQQFVAAQKRAAEIQQQLLPLKTLEQRLVDQDKLILAAKDQIQSLSAEVAKAEGEAASQEAVLKPKLVALQKRLADLKAAGVQIAEAEGKVAAAQKVLAPPPKPPVKK